MLQKKPDDRFQSAREVADALHGWIAAVETGVTREHVVVGAAGSDSAIKQGSPRLKKARRLDDGDSGSGKESGKGDKLHGPRR